MRKILAPYTGVIENAYPLLRAYLRGVYRSVGAARAAPPPREVPPGLVQAVGPVPLRRDLVAKYLKITDGLDLADAEQGVLSPLYYTTWSLRPFLELLSSDQLALNLLGMVHLENELIVRSPLGLGDRITCQVSLEHLAQEPRGLLLTVLCENRASDRLASESRSLILIRRGKQERRGRAPEPATDERHFEEVRNLRLGADLGRRYGFLVGDVNPIHLHRVTSAAFGFRRPIVHGFCLKAMVAHAVVRAHGRGDLASLERLTIRFRRPVPLPGRIAILTHPAEKRYRVVSADGARLHAEGEYVIK